MFFQTCGKVAADFFHAQIRPSGEQLRLSAWAAGGHHRAFGQLRERAIEAVVVFVNQHIAHVLAFADCAEHEAAWQFRGQILEAVHGKISLLADERHLEFLRKKTFG